MGAGTFGHYEVVDTIGSGGMGAHRLTRHGLDAETTVRLGIELADALEHAHQHGVVHRDLKPSNVFVTPSGRVKLVDFGIAARGRSEPDKTTMVEDVAANVVAGTPPYMPPEIIRGGIADSRSDIWSLGVVLFECLAGVRPFARPTNAEVTTAGFGLSCSPVTH